MADTEGPGTSATERFKKRKAAEAASKPAVVAPEQAVAEEKVSIAVGKRRTILIAPSVMLTTKCKEVDEIDDNIIALAHDMEDLLKNPPPAKVRPIGLAAPQMGESVRVISCMLNPMAAEAANQEIVSIVNPQVVYIKKMHLVTETCLSLPGKTYELKRGKVAKIKGMLLDGTPKVFKGHDIVAQMFQHELDHLDGLLLDVTSKR